MLTRIPLPPQPPPPCPGTSLQVRDLLPAHPHLRLVLMSATLHVDLFSGGRLVACGGCAHVRHCCPVGCAGCCAVVCPPGSLRGAPRLSLRPPPPRLPAIPPPGYFGGCPVVRVPGFTHPVEDFYLEHVLQVGLQSAGRVAARVDWLAVWMAVWRQFHLEHVLQVGQAGQRTGWRAPVRCRWPSGRVANPSDHKPAPRLPCTPAEQLTGYQEAAMQELGGLTGGSGAAAGAGAAGAAALPAEERRQVEAAIEAAFTQGTGGWAGGWVGGWAGQQACAMPRWVPALPAAVAPLFSRPACL